MKTVFWGMTLLVLGALIAVRTMPTDPAIRHVKIDSTEDKDFDGGAIRIIDGDAQAFAKLMAAAQSTKRTKLIAGSEAEGHVTFQTRSFWIGYPDYTTIERSGDQIKLYARLRFGRKDFGVNKARLRSWLSQL